MFEPTRKLITTMLGLALAGGLAAAPAEADDVADFYSGKTVSVVIPYSAGGLYGTFGQILVSHLGKHIPGEPNTIAQFMPGAGGVKALNHAYTAAAKDGTVLTTPAAGVVTLPLLKPDSVRYDPANFNFLGAWGEAVYTMTVFHTAPVKTLEDAMKTESILGTTGKSSLNYQLPFMTNNMLGTKFKLITGYGGGAPIRLAMERGEVHGFAGNWLGWKSTKPDWIRDGKLVHLVQFGSRRSPDLPDVPLLNEYAKTDRERAVFGFIADSGLCAFGLVAPPEVPEERLAALATAYADMLADPDFKADAAKRGFPIDPLSRQEVSGAVDRLMALSQGDLADIRKVMGYAN